MKIHILNYEPNRTGGGWTQARYLYDGLDCVSYEESDCVLITGPTMASHEQVEQAKRDGKRVVLRVDNAVRNSRNRGTGMSRMKAFADIADLIIYQSQWARNFLLPYLKKDGAVILNGVDLNVFNDKNRQAPDNTYLYARSSRDEGKGWINAWYWFTEWNNHCIDLAIRPVLEIVGKFSGENLQYNFDFFNDEQWRFTGESNNMPEVYSRNKYFLYTYTNDACSNTLLEAVASGCEIIDVYGMLSTGGAPEIMACEDISLERMIKEYKEAILRL